MAEKSCTRPLATIGAPTAAQLEVPQLFEPVERAPVEVPDWAAPGGLDDFPFRFRPVLWFLASLTRASYAATGTLFSQVARCVVPNDYPITFSPNAGLTPGFGTINCPSCVILTVSGTTNLAQWQEQIFNTPLVPFTFSNVLNIPAAKAAYVMSIYDSVANAIATSAPAGFLTKPVLVCGHSLGGAVALLLAAKAVCRGQPVHCLTFASPKPGDSNFAAVLPRDEDHLTRLWISNDMVPGLPPDLGALRMVAPPALQATAEQWAHYRQPGRLRQVEDDGTVNLADEPAPVVQIASALIAAAAGRPLDLSTSHAMRSFTDRMNAGSAGLDAARGLRWRNPAGLEAANVTMNDQGL